MEQFALSSLKEAHLALSKLIENREQISNIVKASDLISSVFSSGGKAISCGNGGSHCDAMHFAEEFSGRFRDNRNAFPALAVSDPSHISCTGNDFGFDYIFSRFVEAHGRKGDLLLGISTSGKSRNIVIAAEEARKRGMKVISLTGKKDSALSKIADIDICTEGGSGYADRVQELHIKVIHVLIELVERKLCPQNY